MEPIICEICYEFLNNPSEYLAHQKAEHEEEEEEEDKPCSCLECEREREREERDFYTVKIRIVEEGANG